MVETRKSLEILTEKNQTSKDQIETGLKLFHLIRRDKKPNLDRFLYRGSNYGTIYQSAGLAIAKSAEDAVDIVWKEAAAGAKTSGIIPVDKAKWRAREVIIPGYIIIVKERFPEALTVEQFKLACVSDDVLTDGPICPKCYSGAIQYLGDHWECSDCQWQTVKVEYKPEPLKGINPNEDIRCDYGGDD